MNAFEFGYRLLQKQAVGPATGNPAEFPFADTRTQLGKLHQSSPEAFQRVGLPAFSPDWSSRQVYDAAKAFSTAPRGQYNAGMAPGARAAERAYDAARKQFSTTVTSASPPVFAQPGTPGAAKAAPMQAPQPPAAPPPPRVPAPASAPAVPAQSPAAQFGWKLGQPVPAGHVVNDRNELVQQSADFKRINAPQPPNPPRMPGQR